MKKSDLQRRSALTLVEVIIVLGSVMLFAALLLPALFHARSGPGGANCMSNLKQVGLGWLTWVHDQETEEFPFRTLGSTDPLRNNAWWQFALISNEVSSPKVLVCPADKNVGLPRRLADNWSATDTNGGFMAPGFRHQATSYTIGLEATQPRAGMEERNWEGRILGTDRNILFDGSNGVCSSGLAGTRVIRVKGRNGQNPPATAPWTNAIHGLRGNVLLLDGSVHQTSSKELDAFCDQSDDNGSIHFLVPK